MSENFKIYDNDLNPVLKNATSEELDTLVEYQKMKFSEFLTVSEEYKKYAPDHSRYPDLIAKELRDFGGNTLVNIFRGEGPSYYAITCKVAKKIKAPFKKDQDIETIENSILSSILEKAWQKMTEEERKALMDSLGISNKAALKGASSGIFQAIFRAGGFKSYQLTVIIANHISRFVLGRGLPFILTGNLMHWAKVLTGPVGWAITSIWTLVDIAGPSYKVTIPSVVHVALLRKIHNSTICSNCEEFFQNNDNNFCPNCGDKLQAA